MVVSLQQSLLPSQERGKRGDVRVEPGDGDSSEGCDCRLEDFCGGTRFPLISETGFELLLKGSPPVSADERRKGFDGGGRPGEARVQSLNSEVAFVLFKLFK